MVKKKITPSKDGMRNTSVDDYFRVAKQTTEDKNKEKPLKNDEIAAFLVGNNDNTNDNSTTTNTTTTTTRPKEATIMGTDTAPVDEENELGLGKTDGEESKRSDDEEEA